MEFICIDQNISGMSNGPDQNNTHMHLQLILYFFKSVLGIFKLKNNFILLAFMLSSVCINSQQ